MDGLRAFLEYQEPALEEWDKAIEEFRDRISEHGEALKTVIEKEHKTNKAFITAFGDFAALCRSSLNPNLSEPAVEEMLIQHILTERIFRKIFDVGDFMQRNVIAAEIEKVVQALTSRHFSRDEFLKTLDRFYVAIEHAASTITDFSEKQKFLNTVYERFFQGFAVKVADTMGIVYTPQPIVDFMVRSVEYLLEKEFKKSLAHKQVHILDGFTGTGNFIVNIMQEIPRSSLPHKFDDELHCNEVMLLPYYIASMNIEHAYFEATGQYKPFEGICLVDTFETAEKKQAEFALFNERNTERVARQKRAPIFVCIGNPPYNAWQQDENDNNKNRKYHELDRRVAETYAQDSTATLKNSLSDPYVKAIRWASDRIGTEGIVSFVTNSGFVDGIATDGMRKHLARDFDLIYVLDLGGNVRKNPKLSGTTHNVFGIQVGVTITCFVRLQQIDSSKRRNAKIFYHAAPTDWRKEQKYGFLKEAVDCKHIDWELLQPDSKGNWLTTGLDSRFDQFRPLGSKATKGMSSDAIFRTFSNGVKSNCDAYVLNFNREALIKQARAMVVDYNSQRDRWMRAGCPKALDNVLQVDESVHKWIYDTKESLLKGREAEYDERHIRQSLFRPFTPQYYFFDPLFNNRLYLFRDFLPTVDTEAANRVICVSQTNEKPFTVLATNRIANLVVTGGFGSVTQCFPFYTYNEDGTEKRENIPLGTLVSFQNHYENSKITKWDIFHYIYALLHHPEYREAFAGNLKRELPRIPLIGGVTAFHDLAATGKALTKLHVKYESVKEFPLKHIEDKEVPLNWRVEKMKLTPDKGRIIYNEFLTLDGIPAKAFEYRLGNRSALEWVIDQYQVSVDPRSGIESDPNRLDDEQYIVRLIGQVITVSLETQKLIESLPEIDLATAS